jgi:hypothetical protein
MTVSHIGQPPECSSKPRWLSLDEQARRQGVRPIDSVGELVEPGTFDSDAELDEFPGSVCLTDGGRGAAMSYQTAHCRRSAPGHCCHDR